MLRLDARQEALLRLPDPTSFIPKLALEIKRDFPRQVASLSDRQLLDDTERSYNHASYVLHITRLSTLVRWVKADVASGGQLRREMSVDLHLKKAANPNLTAEDIMSVVSAQQRWKK